MIALTNKANCTGCHACKAACPRNCIHMEADSEGFLYPIVDRSRCVQCGLCESACPVLQRAVTSNRPEAYAAQSKDDDLRYVSSSGGIFTEISCSIIRSGGVVFGAAFDEGFAVKHIWVETLEDLAKLRGAKYVQSEIGEAYGQARRFLQNGRIVLFSGTPCQISGLRSFLGREYGNLLTQDIICHGVPSPLVWEKYIQYRESEKKKKVSGVTFRNKEHGWKGYHVCFEFDDRTRNLRSSSDDQYMRSFLSDLCLRPSCHECTFKAQNRASDLTLADFWGIDKVLPDMDDDRGTSLVIVNTDRGREVFDEIRNHLTWKKVDLERALQYNPAMNVSATAHPKRNEFMQCIETDGFACAAKRYLKVPAIVRVKKTIKAILRKK